MRSKVVRALRPLDALAIENAVHAGTPDVNYIGGWIELKRAYKLPKRADTPLACPHFTPQQRVFLRRRRHKGGRAFLLLLVDDVWMLFDGCTAATFLDDLPYAKLREIAIRVWPGGFDEQELRELLTAPVTPCRCKGRPDLQEVNE